MEQTTMTAAGSYTRQSQHAFAIIPGPTAPFFHSWRVLPNIGKWAIVRQGEPTIVVVAVYQNIARRHGANHNDSSRQLHPPITTRICDHTWANCPLFSFLESVAKYWQMGHCETRRANHCCGSVSKHTLGPWNKPQRKQKAATTA